MSDNINVEVRRKNPSIPPKNLRQLTKQVAEIEGTIDDINESVEEAEQDVNEIKTAIDNSNDFTIRNGKMVRKNKRYAPAQYSGLGEIYLEKNETFLGREFDEFVVNVDVPDPTAIAETFEGLVYDRHRKEFLVYELVDGERVYYAEWIKFNKWESTDDYIPEAGYDFICEADDKAYRWTEETTPDLIESVAHYGNVLKQEMVNFSNTIYHIQYDYTLIGKEITIPEGCLLEFEGGTISNGILVGQNTILVYNQPLNDILTATLEGTWRHESGVKADEEDITDINGELKFKDKAYIPANYSGLGRKYLRKNIVNGVNTLTQEMVSDDNTIYVIQYDFILAEDITIPANCVLEFDGGSIGGGFSLEGNNTRINACHAKIFDLTNTAFTVSGTWIVLHIYSEWFKKTSRDTKVLKSIFGLANDDVHNEIYLNELLYSLEGYDTGNNTPFVLGIPSNTTVYLNGEIQIEETAQIQSLPIYIERKDNVRWIGGTITGTCVSSPTSTNTASEHRNGISVYGSHNVYIEGVSTNKFFGDGIHLQYDPRHNKDISIINCRASNNARHGIAICDGENVKVERFYISGIASIYNEQGVGIDIETDYDNAIIKNVHISNGLFNNTIRPDVSIQMVSFETSESGVNVTGYESIIVENCRGKHNVVTGCASDRNSRVIIKDCDFAQIMSENSHRAIKGLQIINCNCNKIRYIGVELGNVEVIGCKVNLIVVYNITTTNETKFDVFDSIINDGVDCVFANVYNSTINHINPGDGSQTQDYWDVLDFAGNYYNCKFNIDGYIRWAGNITLNPIMENCVIRTNNNANLATTRLVALATGGITYTFVDCSFIAPTDNFFKPNWDVESNLNVKLIGGTFDSQYKRAIESFDYLTMQYDIGFSTIENGKPIWWNGTAWVDATGTTV